MRRYFPGHTLSTTLKCKRRIPALKSRMASTMCVPASAPSKTLARLQVPPRPFYAEPIQAVRALPASAAKYATKDGRIRASAADKNASTLGVASPSLFRYIPYQ